MFSLPLKSDSDYLDVCERELAADFNRDKLLNQIRGGVPTRTVFCADVPAGRADRASTKNTNLFRFLHHSIARTCEHLSITQRSGSSS